MNTKTLKAIKLSKEEVEILFKSAMADDGTLKKSKNHIKKSCENRNHAEAAGKGKKIPSDFGKNHSIKISLNGVRRFDSVAGISKNKKERLKGGKYEEFILVYER